MTNYTTPDSLPAPDATDPVQTHIDIRALALQVQARITALTVSCPALTTGLSSPGTPGIMNIGGTPTENTLGATVGTSSITVPLAGAYLCDYHDTGSASGSGYVQFLVNSGGVNVVNDFVTTPRASVVGVIRLAAGDTITVQQQSSVAKTVSSGGGYTRLARISA